MEVSTPSIIDQLIQIVGLQSSDPVLYDFFGLLFLLVVSLICYNLIFLFVHTFFRKE